MASEQPEPRTTVDVAVLEELRNQKLRSLARSTTHLADELTDAVGRIRAGHTVHSTVFTNMARQVADLAAYVAAVELIDQVTNRR